LEIAVAAARAAVFAGVIEAIRSGTWTQWIL